MGPCRPALLLELSGAAPRPCGPSSLRSWPNSSLRCEGAADTAAHPRQVLPYAKFDTYAEEFAETTLPLPEVQAALAAQAEPLTTFFEEISAGRDFLELDQWIGALESKLLCSDVTIDGFAVRLTEPQARAAFYAACASAESGLTPAELSTCVARAGYDKYKHVTPMGPGAKVGGFLENLFGESDEEDVVVASTGGARPGGSGSGGDAPAAPVEEAAEGGDGAEEEEAAGEED